MDTDNDYIFKVLVLGDSGVGKTKVVQQFCDRGLSGILTIGIDFSIKTLKIGIKRLQFQIWVTTGQERFSTIRRIHYKSTDVFIIVYDITSHKSFQSINKWLQEIQEFCGDAVFKVLIGNNCDKQKSRQVSTVDGNVLAEKENMPFLEIGAKKNSGIDQLFQNLGEQLLAQKVGKLKQSRERRHTVTGEDSLCERREGGFGRKCRSKSTLKHIPSIKDSSKIIRTESDRIPTFPQGPRETEPDPIPTFPQDPRETEPVRIPTFPPNPRETESVRIPIKTPSLDSPFINQDVSIDRFRDNLPSVEVEFNLEQLDIVEPGSYVETVRENVRVSKERINEIIARSHQNLDEKKRKLLKSLDDYMAEVNKRVADLLQTRVQYAKSMEDFDATLKDNTAQDTKVGILKILNENIEKVDKQIGDLDVHKLRVVESIENYPCYISKISRKFRTPKWCGIDKGTELNQLYDPHSIVVDTALHRLYIADHAMHRIQVFDLAGKYIQTFSNAHTSFPVYLSLIESGLLISSPNLKKLVTISKESGAFQTEKSFPQGFVGIDYDPTTNLVYACTVNTNKLYCLDAELNISYETQLENAHGTHTHPRNRLAIDCKVRNNELYILFPYRDQPLHIFTLNGEVKRSILSRDYLHFGFRLNFTNTGGIVVSDLSAMQVKIFSQEGEPVGMIGERGEGRGRFYQPTGVAVTPDDVIVVCDLKNAFMLQAF